MQVRYVVGLDNGVSIPNLPAIEEDDYIRVYSGHDLLDHQDVLLDAWLAMPDFSCCRMQTGYYITIDGHSARYDALDHFWHMRGWFYALSHILAGPESEVSTFVWDESSLTMLRRGDSLTMYDGFPDPGRYTFPPVTFPLGPFADQFVREGQYSVALMEGLIQRLTARGHDPSRLMACIQPLGDKPYPAPDDLELKAAIIYRELYQPEYFASVAESARLLGQLGDLP